MTTRVDPTLAGKVAIVAGTPAATLLAVVEAFAANRMPVAVVSPDRDMTMTAANLFADTDVGVLAVTGDPLDPALWQRVVSHAEQRLGPIDVVVLAGSADLRDHVVSTLLPDMAARKRGVIIELGADLTDRAAPNGVHHYLAASAAEVVGLAATGSS